MKTRPPSPRKKEILELVTANGIAKELGRSTRSVIDKIRTLRIQPEGASITGKLYRREVIATVKAAMRAPNKTARSTSTGN